MTVPGSLYTPLIRKIRSSGHIIEGSGLFDGSTATLERTPSSTGNRRTWTISQVFKLGSDIGEQRYLFYAYDGAGSSGFARIDTTEKLYTHPTASGDQYVSTQLFRDYSGYVHMVFAFDSTQATAADRYKVYVNGTQITDWDSGTAPTLNADSKFNWSSSPTVIGSATGAGAPFDGYMAQAVMIDGLQLAPTDFGEVTEDGFWQINNVSGLTFGTNGFLIEGGSAMAAGTDSSGNSNDYTKSGSIISTLDSPTNDSTNEYGNYCTLSPLWQTRSGTSKSILSNGNLTVKTNGSTIGEALGSIAADSSGKSTYETTVTAVGSNCLIGFAGSTYIDGNATFRVAWRNNGIVYFGSSSTYSSSDTYTTGDVVRCELNMTTGALQFFKNGTLASDASSPSFAMHTNVQDSGWLPYIGLSTNASSGVTCNFGASSFAATPTSGFLPIATQNLPEPAVINYEDEYYIEANISHSNGSTTAVTLPKTVSGGAMVRLKRTDSTGDWYLFDTVRGANKSVKWNAFVAEDTSWSNQNLTGTTFTIPSSMATGTYLLECFYVGSYFQIKTYTGNGANRTITYDTALDTAAGFFACIKRETAGGSLHISYHESLGPTKYLALTTSNLAAAVAQSFNNTAPSTTGFTIGTNEINANSGTYVSYHWANSGPYAFGSYTGNSNADGPLISMNGSPSSTMIKRTSATENWLLLNALEPGYNLVDNVNYLNLTNAMAVNHGTTRIDILSNGAKVRGTNTNINSGTYIYGAFGIQPLTDGAINQARADGRVPPYDQANGGTTKRVGNFWVHTFNSSGTFTPHEDMVADYLVIAGGGAGGAYRGGGGGAGGYRSSWNSEASGGGGSSETALNLTAGTTYTVTIGAGGAGGAFNALGGSGGNSVFSSITSIGGSGGQAGSFTGAIAVGGSGGGAAQTAVGGLGTSNQGFNGGQGSASNPVGGGGGGGASEVGANSASAAGDGGDGVASTISGTSIVRAGGGGGGAHTGPAIAPGAGGAGGGAAGSSTGTGNAGTVNTGGGGGAISYTGSYASQTGGAGGSGVVIIRYAIS